MSLCNEHRFLVSGVITSKPLQHTISMSGHEAFSACDNNSPSKSPSNKSFLVPNLFVWHFSFWTQLQKKTHFEFESLFEGCTQALQGVKVISFFWGIVCFSARIGSFQNLSKNFFRDWLLHPVPCSTEVVL